MNEEIRLILKQLNLLYVEDNLSLTKEVQTIFDDVFHTIYTAIDGIEASDYLKKHKIDIIITDLNMPNKDGMELIKEIRERNKKVSIIILTAYTDNHLLIEASNLQIDGYLKKPINLIKVITALSNAVQRLDYHPEYILSDGTTYNINLKQIIKGETILDLGKKESQLLDFLLLNSHRVVNKDEITYHIWDMENVTESALKNLLSNLRSKIGKNNIENYPGHGWKIITQ